MNLTNATVLVTGANRGLGQEFARQALERGAAKVYATARRAGSVGLPGVESFELDITDPDAVTRAAVRAADVDVLVNNAGIATMQNLVTGDPELIRAELDTHFYGTLAMTRAFAPVLAANGGGAILNVLSVLAFRVFPGSGAYAAAKAAESAPTDSARLELAGQGTQVTGLYLAAADTDMMAGWDVDKSTPAEIVTAAYDGLAAGHAEVMADEVTRTAKALLAEPAEVRFAAFTSTT